MLRSSICEFRIEVIEAIEALTAQLKTETLDWACRLSSASGDPDGIAVGLEVGSQVLRSRSLEAP